jgi:hypothetical protein
VSELALLAQAALGDGDALATVVGDPRLVDAAVIHRLLPRFARLSHDQGLRSPHGERLASARRNAAVAHLLIDGLLAQAVPALEGTTWCLIKGADLRDRVWESREDRVLGDVDVLIDEAALAAVRERLGGRGIHDIHPSGPHYERFLAEEAHAWQAVLPQVGVLEVHPRLWGLLPSRAAADVLATAGGDPPRPSLAVAFVLAAVHAFLDAPPRRLAGWLELHLIARQLDDAGRVQVGELTRAWGVALPLTAALAASRQYFPVDLVLEAGLRPLERWVLRSQPAADLPLARLALARLLSGRPSRMGWKAIWRRVWVHPGLVERSTPAEWSWPRRRLQALGLVPGPGPRKA